MTNTELLQKKIKESGFKLSYIAEKVGICRTSLQLKVRGLSSFNQFEINKLCDVLNITSLTEKEAIFFAKDVS